ncbi:MAG: prolipoprotein diacylglyceryl transferase family protein [Prolixibacteraceae bacterium]
MFPYLSDLFNYFFGTNLVIPLYTYTNILFLDLIAASCIIYVELKRKETCGQIPISSKKLIWKICAVIFLACMPGLKLFHILDHWQYFVKDPSRMLLSFNGISIYGGLLFGIVGAVTYMSHKKITHPHTFDIAATSILLGYAIGRCACQLSGDGCWGIVNLKPQPDWLAFLPDWVWSFRYPHNGINAGYPIPGCEGAHCMILPRPVFPTPIYGIKCKTCGATTLRRIVSTI